MKKVSLLNAVKTGAVSLALVALGATSTFAHGSGWVSSPQVEYEVSAMSYTSGISDPSHDHFAMSGAYTTTSVKAHAGNDWAVTKSSSEGTAFKVGYADAGYEAAGGIEVSKDSRHLDYDSNSHTFVMGNAYSDNAARKRVSSETHVRNTVSADLGRCKGDACSASFGYADHYGNAVASYMAGGDITGSRGSYDGVYVPYPED